MHDHHDWDSELAESIFDALLWFYVWDGRPNWFTILLSLIGLGLLLYHWLG